MAQGPARRTPEQLERVKDMLASSTACFEMRNRASDTQPAFEDFMSRYGDLFPGSPRTLDELLETWRADGRDLAADGVAQPAQRAELQDLVDQTMQDMDVAFEMDRLARTLRGGPVHGWTTRRGRWGTSAADGRDLGSALERQH